jgi:hypothetical protein
MNERLSRLAIASGGAGYRRVRDIENEMRRDIQKREAEAAIESRRFDPGKFFSGLLSLGGAAAGGWLGDDPWSGAMMGLSGGAGLGEMLFNQGGPGALMQGVSMPMQLLNQRYMQRQSPAMQPRAGTPSGGGHAGIPPAMPTGHASYGPYWDV